MLCCKTYLGHTWKSVENGRLSGNGRIEQQLDATYFGVLFFRAWNKPVEKLSKEKLTKFSCPIIQLLYNFIIGVVYFSVKIRYSSTS